MNSFGNSARDDIILSCARDDLIIICARDNLFRFRCDFSCIKGYVSHFEYKPDISCFLRQASCNFSFFLSVSKSFV